jgi:hypothetical protein
MADTESKSSDKSATDPASHRRSDSGKKYNAMDAFLAPKPYEEELTEEEKAIDRENWEEWLKNPPSEEIFERYRIKRRMSNRDIPILIIISLIVMLLSHQYGIVPLFVGSIVLFVGLLLLRFMVWRCPACEMSLFSKFTILEFCPYCNVPFYKENMDHYKEVQKHMDETSAPEKPDDD